MIFWGFWAWDQRDFDGIFEEKNVIFMFLKKMQITPCFAVLLKFSGAGCGWGNKFKMSTFFEMSKTDEHFFNRWASQMSTEIQMSKPDEHFFFRWASQMSTFFLDEQIWMSTFYFQMSTFYFEMSNCRHCVRSTSWEEQPLVESLCKTKYWRKFY